MVAIYRGGEEQTELAAVRHRRCRKMGESHFSTSPRVMPKQSEGEPVGKGLH
ncbi:hypothetical protein [Alloprevotella rava]|uniref:Uncharacterized protein n=1 Tax=Alloprevotella rava TaxID=671218 RepID=A0A7W5UKS3_9BACT|nr:hypothetical protein [Alloprevotella rava]MBB3703318.1 hypothetical protein [Alloprevotella rava]